MRRYYEAICEKKKKKTVKERKNNNFFPVIILGTASKPNRRLKGGSVRFRPVSIDRNNNNRPEPDGTACRPAVGFWSRPLETSHFHQVYDKIFLERIH